ncbi:hypothetical protein DPX16_17624, partial [Anabarilius grahami]
LQLAVASLTPERPCEYTFAFSLSASAERSLCTGIRAIGKEPPHSVRRLDARIHCSSEEDRGAFTLFFLKGVGRARWIPTSAGAFSK